MPAYRGADGVLTEYQKEEIKKRVLLGHTHSQMARDLGATRNQVGGYLKRSGDAAYDVEELVYWVSEGYAMNWIARRLSLKPTQIRAYWGAFLASKTGYQWS